MVVSILMIQTAVPLPLLTEFPEKSESARAEREEGTGTSRFSGSTVERYLDSVRSFAKFHRSPDQMGPKQIREYLLAKPSV
jgi:hypothetical protein